MTNTLPEVEALHKDIFQEFFGRLVMAAFFIAVVSTGLMPAQLHAQESVATPDGVNVPGFWDPNRRFTKPDRTKVRAIRFLTEQESPPFSFTAPDGLPAGFNVDIARAICKELAVPCTIQELKWELLVDGINEGRGDAIIAPIAITPQTRKTFAFTNPFLGRPGRFVATRSTLIEDVTPQVLAERKVGVVTGTPHAAFIATYFPGANVVPFEATPKAREALSGGAIDVLFADALASSAWLNSEAASGCCMFLGEAYTDSHFFGEGMAVAVDRERKALREAIDFALSRIYASGLYFEIFLRYFPRGYY